MKIGREQGSSAHIDQIRKSPSFDQEQRDHTWIMPITPASLFRKPSTHTTVLTEKNDESTLSLESAVSEIEAVSDRAQNHGRTPREQIIFEANNGNRRPQDALNVLIKEQACIGSDGGKGSLSPSDIVALEQLASDVIKGVAALGEAIGGAIKVVKGKTSPSQKTPTFTRGETPHVPQLNPTERMANDRWWDMQKSRSGWWGPPRRRW